MSNILKGLNEGYFSRDEENQQNAMNTRRNSDLSRERNAGLDEPDDTASAPVQTRNGVYEYTVPAGQEDIAQELGLQQHKGHWVSRVPIQRANFQFGRPQFHEIPSKGVAEGSAEAPVKHHTVLVSYHKKDDPHRRYEARFKTTHNLGKEETEKRAKAAFAAKGKVVYNIVHEQGVAEGSATQWEVSFDYGPHMTKSVTVKARSEQEARDKVEKAAEKKGMSIMINSVEPAEQGVAEGPSFDKWADERAASQLHKLKPGMVQDRKTGKWYDPKKEFDKKMNSPEVMAQMKRMATKEGKEDKIAQLKKDHATAVHWSKNETSPQKREAARQKAEKIKRHLDTQYKQGVAEAEIDRPGMKDGRPYSDPYRRHPGNSSYMTPEYLIQKYKERLEQIAAGPYKRPKEVAQLQSRIAKLEKQGVAETNVSKYADMGATDDTTHFIKNITTGEIVSPHRGIQDAQDALVANIRDSHQSGSKDEFKIVRARKSGVAEEQLDELSNNTLASYKKKAGADATQADKRGDYARGNKRMSGIVKATKKEFDNDAKGVTEAGNKPIDRQFPLGTGDTRTPRDIKGQMRDASDKFVQQTAASKTGPFHSRVAKMQNKMAKSELRKRDDHDRLATGTNEEMSEEKQRLDPSCWKGYKKQGTKMKGDTRVNNCVPIKKESAIMKGLK